MRLFAIVLVGLFIGTAQAQPADQTDPALISTAEEVLANDLARTLVQNARMAARINVMQRQIVALQGQLKAVQTPPERPTEKPEGNQ